MSRFYVKPANIKGRNIYIDGDEAHHILDVMRLKKGDRIITFDGKGKEYEGIISDTAKTKAIVEIIKTKDMEVTEKIDITLAQAIPKRAKIDFIIEKSVELGINTIIPIYSSRTIVRFSKEKIDSRCKRWQRIAISASKQCGRVNVPTLQSVTDFVQIIKKARNYDLAIMACLHKNTQDIKKVIRGFKGKTFIVFIGPEGDFTEEEIEAAEAEGCRLVSLGPRVLKADTAAINLLSILQYELG